MATKVAKKKFSQAEYDKLVMRKAKANLSLRVARRKLSEYERTHTSGITRKRKGETWV